MKHTKGKWTPVYIKYVDGSGGNYYIKNELGNSFITVWGITEEPKANAKLISKAPEMYEALNNIIDKATGKDINALDGPLFESLYRAQELLKEIEL